MGSAWNDVARVPLQVVRGCLVASVQVELTREVLHAFQQDLLVRLRDTRARAVILDLSGVSILDSSDFESILRTLKMASLMSATPVIVGLRPGIAASLVELGVSPGDVAACHSLEQAFNLIERPRPRPGPEVPMEYRVAIHDEPDATRAIMQARRSAAKAGFDAARVTMIGTIASELVRNILKYAGSGEFIIRSVEEDGTQGLEMVASDRGPGIADIDRAMQDHVSSSGTLGLGLPGVKRMTDDMKVESTVGKGTTVTVRKWAR